MHVDGTQYVEVLGDSALLEEPLHFKTTSTGIVVGEDVKDYSKSPSGLVSEYNGAVTRVQN